MTSIIAPNAVPGSQLAGCPHVDDSSPASDSYIETGSMRSESRSSSVSPTEDRRFWDEKTGYGMDSDDEGEGEGEDEGEGNVCIGLLPEDVYEEAMNSWRSSIRRRIRNSVIWESDVLARMQVRRRCRLHDVCGSSPIRRTASARHSWILTLCIPPRSGRTRSS